MLLDNLFLCHIVKHRAVEEYLGSVLRNIRGNNFCGNRTSARRKSKFSAVFNKIFYGFNVAGRNIRSLGKKGFVKVADHKITAEFSHIKAPFSRSSERVLSAALRKKLSDRHPLEQRPHL